MPPQFDLITSLAGLGGALLAFVFGRNIPIIERLAMLVIGTFLACIGAAPLTELLEVRRSVMPLVGFLIGLIGTLGCWKLYTGVDAINLGDLWPPIRDAIADRFKRKGSKGSHDGNN